MDETEETKTNLLDRLPKAVVGLPIPLIKDQDCIPDSTRVRRDCMEELCGSALVLGDDIPLSDGTIPLCPLLHSASPTHTTRGLTEVTTTLNSESFHPTFHPARVTISPTTPFPNLLLRGGKKWTFFNESISISRSKMGSSDWEA